MLSFRFDAFVDKQGLARWALHGGMTLMGGQRPHGRHTVGQRAMMGGIGEVWRLSKMTHDGAGCATNSHGAAAAGGRGPGEHGGAGAQLIEIMESLSRACHGGQNAWPARVRWGQELEQSQPGRS